MAFRSEPLSVHPFRSSSSSSSAAAPVFVRQSDHQAHHLSRDESTLDESTRAYRTTALRQSNGTPKSAVQSWKNRQAFHPGIRPSTLASQPVLVRAYSGGPEDSSPAPTMSLRRSFPFVRGSRPQRRVPMFPSDEEFSIDGILRAIEPNIRTTLDSIGEICGRSKLSLANEYGSHIAPLGEIRAPPGGLLTVEETSSDHERQASDNVVIYDDENSVTDGRDHISFSHYGYFEHARPPMTTAPPYRGFQRATLPAGDVSSMPGESTTLRSARFNPISDPNAALRPSATSGESTSQRRSYGRALLGRELGSDRTQGILTPALVSEILLDAQADGRPGADILGDRRNSPGGAHQPSTIVDVRALFGWLMHFAGHGTDSGESNLTAEMRLRAMLERPREQVLSDVHSIG
ncbi:hypothetical protein EYZ11_008898 [Aspergillus tanneri]|uniref:Uncharacterized protein n=1 Tax=Aspergillus tanneri TaxID=1220188 RepID=A0A4S3J9F9_9EURO|nr:uncharacterized protein ATNIH1004_009831 [Aspergillus tanneri]KAA8643069.1 hypothetical protein ATNIH1004_009831 [Aspergillus tanneri]THC91650.1 hypothetical protein EYZ11_008898 [Aspergillus tanneri]